MRADLTLLGDAVVVAVKGYVQKAVESLSRRLDDLDARLKTLPAGPQGERGAIGERGEKGLPGERGETGTAGPAGLQGPVGPQGSSGERGEKGEQGVAGERGADGSQGPEGKAGETGAPGAKGADGASGKDGAPGAAGERGEKGEAGPVGRDGATGAAGQKGDPGERGADGSEGIQGKDGAPGPAGPQGEKGSDGAAGTNGRDGAPGPEGQKGLDGRSVTVEEVRPLLEGEVGRWALDFERRAADILQRAVDKLPKPENGADGLGFDDLTFEHDGGRNAVLRFVRGDQVKEFAFKVPAFIDCGVYKSGATYQKGDGVTYGGSFWIAQEDTELGPGVGGDDWRLAVKRGRDAKA
jgi:collagen triple helix repeat protein